VYMLVRFFFTIFGPTFSLGVMSFQAVLLPLALIAILSASLTAIFQRNVKRLLAYSSVAQVGYMILGIGLASVTGLTAGLLHLFNHALIKAALFMAVGAVMYQVGSVRIEAMRGLGKKMPWTMAAFVLGGPLSHRRARERWGSSASGTLVLAAVEAGLWPIAGVVLIGSLMALVYIWRVVEAAYFHEFVGTPGGIEEAPLTLLIPTWTLVLANVYFGLHSTPTTEDRHPGRRGSVWGLSLEPAPRFLSELSCRRGRLPSWPCCCRSSAPVFIGLFRNKPNLREAATLTTGVALFGVVLVPLACDHGRRAAPDHLWRCPLPGIPPAPGSRAPGLSVSPWWPRPSGS
jgi:hypothetical protein